MKASILSLVPFVAGLAAANYNTPPANSYDSPADGGSSYGPGNCPQVKLYSLETRCEPKNRPECANVKCAQIFPAPITIPCDCPINEVYLNQCGDCCPHLNPKYKYPEDCHAKNYDSGNGGNGYDDGDKDHGGSRTPGYGRGDRRHRGGNGRGPHGRPPYWGTRGGRDHRGGRGGHDRWSGRGGWGRDRYNGGRDRDGYHRGGRGPRGGDRDRHHRDGPKKDDYKGGKNDGKKDKDCDENNKKPVPARRPY